MILECPKKLYLAHLKVLLISEDVAKDNLEDSFDFFVRDFETSNDFYFLIAKDSKPQEILNITPTIEETISDKIEKSLETTAKYMGSSDDNTLNDTLYTCLCDGKEVVMPSIYIRKKDGDENLAKEQGQESEDSMLTATTQNSSGSSSVVGDSQNGNDSKENTEEEIEVVIGNMAYFKYNKFQGYLTDEESIMCNIINKKAKDLVLEINDKYSFVAEFISVSSKMKPKFENGSYIIDIEVSGVCNITEVREHSESLSQDTVDEYVKLIQDKLKSELESFITNCQTKYDSDILGFEELYKKKFNSEYKNMRDTFKDEIFKNIKANITVNAKIPNHGGIYKKW